MDRPIPHVLPRIIALVIALATFITLVAASAGAQGEPATIVDADPRANDVLAESPSQVTITFSTTLDPDTSTVRLLDDNGRAVPGATLAWRAADTASLTLPADLDHGSWLVAWDVTGASGEAEGSGFYGFTVGTDRDVAPVTIPETGFAASSTFTWISMIGYGTLVLGLTVLVAIWPLWAVALAPSGATSGTIGRLQGIALAGVVFATAGALLRIGTLVGVNGRDSLPGRLTAALETSHEARLLLLMLVLVFAHGIVLALMPGSRRTVSRVLLWGATLALPVPLALLSHAAEEPASRFPALVVTWIALLATSTAAGGAVALAWLRTFPSLALFRYALAVAISLPVLTVTGAYLAWLYIGNGNALRTTTYGRAATVTLVLGVAFAVAIGAALLTGRRHSPGRLLAAPAVIGIALAVSAGSLLPLDTARAELTREATQREAPFTIAGDRSQMILAPGAAGVNHLRLELDRPTVAQRTTAHLTMSLAAQPELGRQTVPLSRVDGNAFEYHGTELVIAGRWSLEVTLAEPGNVTSTATIVLDLSEETTTSDLPGTPWRFTDFAGSAGTLMVVLGIAGIAIGIAAGASPLRRESAGLGVAALALAAILIVQGRMDPILATGGAGGAINPDDLAMITRGETVYETYCLTCHGPELRGDGPGADGMQPPPADFSAPHTMVHDEATLTYWLRNGKQGTAMPAYGDILTDDEIRAVLSYIARQQRTLAAQP